MKTSRFLAFLVASWMTIAVHADINLKAIYTDKNGSEVTATDDFTAEAPLHVRFESNPSSLDPSATIEWHIRNATSGLNLTRYDQDTEFDFTVAGLTEVTLQVMQDNAVVESASIRITISESHLEMPNAFSPNGDGINDIYKAKSNYKSIVEFHAYIFNRWGQKLYEWSDITQGWDGTTHGHPVKDGTYYVYVKARGADGIDYNIRRDVNILRNHNEAETSNGGQ